MGKTAKAPEPRNLQNEYKQTVQAQIESQPAILSAMQQYAPQYTALNTSLLSQALQGQLDTAKTLQPQYQAQQQAEIAGNPILAGLQSQALTALAQGGGLSNEDRIAANEVSRSKFAGTGTLGSNRSLLDQILNRSQYSQQRLQQNLSNAQSIYGTLQNANNTGLTQQLISGAQQQVSSPNINPESQYAQDLYNTNYNAANARYISSKNNQAGLAGGLISGITGMFNFGGK